MYKYVLKIEKSLFACILEYFDFQGLASDLTYLHTKSGGRSGIVGERDTLCKYGSVIDTTVVDAVVIQVIVSFVVIMLLHLE